MLAAIPNRASNAFANQSATIQHRLVMSLTEKGFLVKKRLGLASIGAAAAMALSAAPALAAPAYVTLDQALHVRVGAVIGTDASAMRRTESGNTEYGGVSIPAYIKWHMSSDVASMDNSAVTVDATEDSGLECCTTFFDWTDVGTTYDANGQFGGKDASNTTYNVAESYVSLKAYDASGGHTDATATYHMYLKQDSQFSYSGGWVTGSGAVWSGNGVHKSTSAGQTASITATGNEFAVMMDKGSNRGTADIYMDGTRFASVNTYSSTSINRVIVAEKYKVYAGSHTIKIVVTKGRVDLDALIVS